MKYYYVLALLLGYSSCVLAEECMDNSNIDSLREVFKKNNKKLLIEMSSKEMRRYVESDLLIKNKYSTHCQCILGLLWLGSGQKIKVSC